MSALTFVTGRAGSGKSRYLHGLIKELIASGGEVVLIVPEQFTFETERELSMELGGLMDAAVFSFTTLARRVMKEQGFDTVFLSRQGRRMVIRKALDENRDKLTAFGAVCARQGFTETCDELYSLTKRFNITPEALNSAADRLDDSAFSRKLRDLSVIFDAVGAHYDSHTLDSDDALNVLLRLLPDSSLKNKHIMIDGFDLLTEQLYLTVGALMEIASTVHISIREGDGRDAAVFASEARAKARIMKLANEREIPVSTVAMPERDKPPARFLSPEIAHLEHEAFAYPFEKFPGKCENIVLFAGTDRAAEAREAVSEIIRAAKSGVRYREMALIATDMAGYLSPVTRELDRRHIPYFTDRKHKLSMYSAPRLALCALSAVARGFVRDDIISLIRTGMTDIDRADADIFENHILRYGVSGMRLTRPFTQKNTPEAAEKVRLAVMEPLIRLKGTLASAPTAAKKTEALYAYMEELHIYDRIKDRLTSLGDAGQKQLMEENAQVYDTLMELMSQLHAIMGESRISAARYLDIVKEGMDAYEIGAIPTTADQLLFGSVARTRARNIRAAFILGASEGLFPRSCRDEAVFDDAELERFYSLGLTPWDSSVDKNGMELINVYNAISRPSELLYISYPLSEGGEAALQSSVVDRIKELFPDISESSDMLSKADPPDPEDGFRALTDRLKDFADTGAQPDGTAPLYAYYSGSPEYADRLALVEHALYHDNSPEPFGRETAVELYGNMLSGSATRLEKYAACPFMHFMEYGIKALPRREYTERPADDGTFLHGILAEFVRRLNGSLPDEATADAMVDEIASGLAASHNDGIFMDTARGRARGAALVGAVKTAVKCLTFQLNSGSFMPIGAEVAFGEGKPLPPITVESNGVTYKIGGVIDRLDGCNIDGQEYYRAIDYKSTGRELDFSELYAGLSLQLPLYIAAVEAADEAKQAAGLYYMPLTVPPLDGDMPDGKFEKALTDAFRLKGITLEDASITAATNLNPGDVIPTGTGRLISGEIMNAVTLHARERAAEAIDEIMAGHAEIAPAYKAGAQKERALPCRFCEYPSVCGFDMSRPGCACRVINRLGAEEFYRLITGGSEGGKNEVDE